MVSRTALAALLVAALFASGSALFAQGALPPGESGVAAHLTASPRHGEWVRYEAGTEDTMEAWVVYPERSDKAPVVVVIHEIFGLTDWARAVADQLAAEGFLAVAPDFLSGKAPGGQGSRALTPDAARALMGQLQWAEIARRLDATVRSAIAGAAASPSTTPPSSRTWTRRWSTTAPPRPRPASPACRAPCWACTAVTTPG